MKICILGADSTHGELFGKEILNFSTPFLFADIAAIWSPQLKDSKNLASKLGLNCVFNQLDDAVGVADYAFVLGRFAESHFLPAKSALLRGLHTFIDKPMVCNSDELDELLHIANQKKVLLFGGSALIYAEEIISVRDQLSHIDFIKIRCPLSCRDMGQHDSFANINFYGSHITDIVCSLINEGFQATPGVFEDNVYSINFEVRGKLFTLQFCDVIDEFYQIEFGRGEKPTSLKLSLDGSYNQRLVSKTLEGFFNQKIPHEMRNFPTSINLLDLLQHETAVLRGNN